MEKNKITVLGAGNVGSYIANHLAEGYEVTVLDSKHESLQRTGKGAMQRTVADLSDPTTIELSVIQNADLIVSALPESLGYEVSEAVLEAGKHLVDISFWDQTPERMQKLDELAKEKNATAFLDCGIAPGFSNALVGYFASQRGCWDTFAERIDIYCGSIPKDREKGFFAPWSVAGIIEEYVRPPLVIRGGKINRVEALSEIQSIHWGNDMGELEATLTDGIRSLAHNLKVLDMSEYAVRYPGHLDQMIALKRLGFFSDRPRLFGSDTFTYKTAYRISIEALEHAGFDITERRKGKLEHAAKTLADLGFFNAQKEYEGKGLFHKHIPRDVAIDVLSKAWQMQPKDEDIMLLRVEFWPGQGGYDKAILHADHDGTNSALAITTGGMGVLGVQAIASGLFKERGAFPLELAVKIQPDIMQYFSEGLQALPGVQYAGP